MIVFYVYLLIYVFTMIYLSLILAGKTKLTYWTVVGMMVSYAAFGLAFVIENYPG